MVDQEELDWWEHSSKCAHVIMNDYPRNLKKCGLAKLGNLVRLSASTSIYSTVCQPTVCESLGVYMSTTKRIERKGW